MPGLNTGGVTAPITLPLALIAQAHYLTANTSTPDLNHANQTALEPARLSHSHERGRYGYG